MTDHNDDELKKCLIMVKEQVQCIKDISYHALKGEKMPLDIYNKMYKINQKSHDVTRVIDLYF